MHGKEYVTVSNITVPENKRRQGVGTAVMTELTEEADRNGWKLALTPSDEYGVSKPSSQPRAKNRIHRHSVTPRLSGP